VPPKLKSNDELKQLLAGGAPALHAALAARSEAATSLDDALLLATFRRRAESRVVSGLAQASGETAPCSLAVIAGCNTYPLHELITHYLVMGGMQPRLFLGEYDNYIAEILEPGSALYRFEPQVVFLIPSVARCSYTGGLADPRPEPEREAQGTVAQLLDLCARLHERSRAEIVLANFPLPAGFDPGPYRARSLGSPWSFRKLVNLELGLNAPSYVHVCDVEFLAHRIGGTRAEDARGWFESKQQFSPDMTLAVAREVAHIVGGLRRPPRKVLAVDLDNTLWGGVVGDDGVEGIEIGTTSPRGEAYRAFQSHLLGLSRRGLLLAVCSKNDHDKAMEPFQRHPEMVLRPEHFVAFKANWDPKPDNLRAISDELGLGLDSFAFVDDDPLQVDMVERYTPEVAAVLLNPDPAARVRQLEDCRLFEPQSVTREDASRTESYRVRAAQSERLAVISDLGAYLSELEMVARVRGFTEVDVPRISQLINKSNQFNLTTRRRTEAEVRALVGDPAYLAFSVRLSDRFSDHGLISVVIARLEGPSATIDTWLMSCRVLQRRVEEEALNQLAHAAAAQGCETLSGSYLATPKNEMVRELLPRLGFVLVVKERERSDYRLDLRNYTPVATGIRVVRDVVPVGASLP
jgi:FkbH-like protein